MPDETTAPDAPPQKVGRLAGFARSFREILAPTAVGTGGGGIIGLISMALDKTGLAATITTAGGAAIGFARGMSGVVVRHRRDSNIEAARARREMIEAEAGEDRQKRNEEERARRAAEASLAECRAENVTLHAIIAEQGRRIQTLETSIEVERKRTDKLTQLVVELSERLSDVEVSDRKKDAHP